MLSSGGNNTPTNSSNTNQYLQPDYLSPLPTTLDAKKSPLALLAQTCSQIGADSPSSKPLISSLDKSSKKSSEISNLTVRSSPAIQNQQKSKNSKSANNNNNNCGSELKLGFKPYENSIGSNSSSSNSSCKKEETSRPNSKTSISDEKNDNKSETLNCVDSKFSPKNDTEGTSPIIRSGLEVLQGKNVPLKLTNPSLPSTGFNGAFCCPPGFEHLINPAFRPPFPSGPYHQQLLAAAAATQFPNTQPSPFLPYPRIKSGAGTDPLLSVCKDPFCTGCQFNAVVNSQQQLYLAAVASAASVHCPSGCTQCDHQKQLGLAMAMASPLSTASTTSAAAAAAAAAAYPQLNRPYICNWIVGDTYCGKRFNGSDELLQHLRTHTSVPSSSTTSTTPSSATSSTITTASNSSTAVYADNHSPSITTSSHMSTTTAPHPLLSTSTPAAAAAAAASYRNFFNSPLSPLRFHPYAGKPTGLPPPPHLPPPALSSPFSAFSPTASPLAAAAAAYYGPFSLYNSRLGAAVHP